ncbi:MAG: cobalt transporter [Rhodobacteraceae bacterium]|nr:MAG: cobalt transporter [Paracoccaceae bacterium]
MHIEPGVVNGAKILLGTVTAAGSFTLAAKMAFSDARLSGLSALALRSLIATGMVLFFFQILPHHPVGVSEVHLIMGSTIFLLFGAPAAMIALAAGLALQGLFFAPLDLPQYGMNVTSLLVPLYIMSRLAKRIIPAGTPYKDISYKQALVLSTTFQGGIVSWVAFWAFYGQGFGAENLMLVSSFGLAYMSVIIIEPLADLAVLALAKNMGRFRGMFDKRVYNPA